MNYCGRAKLTTRRYGMRFADMDGDRVETLLFRAGSSRFFHQILTTRDEMVRAVVSCNLAAA